MEVTVGDKSYSLTDDGILQVFRALYPKKIEDDHVLVSFDELTKGAQDMMTQILEITRDTLALIDSIKYSRSTRANSQKEHYCLFPLSNIGIKGSIPFSFRVAKVNSFNIKTLAEARRLVPGHSMSQAYRVFAFEGAGGREGKRDKEEVDCAAGTPSAARKELRLSWSSTPGSSRSSSSSSSSMSPWCQQVFSLL